MPSKHSFFPFSVRSLVSLIKYSVIIVLSLYLFHLWLYVPANYLVVFTQTSSLGNPSLQRDLRNPNNLNLTPICVDEDGNGKCLFFIESSERKRLQPLQTCAVESAAKNNPDLIIVILLTAEQSLVNNSLVTVSNQYPNMLYTTVHLESLFRSIGLDSWYNQAQNSQYWRNHISDALRIVFLHLYGGVYNDLDIINLRSYESMTDGVCLERLGILSDPLVSFFRTGLLPYVGIPTGVEHDFLTVNNMIKLSQPCHPLTAQVLQFLNHSSSYSPTCYRCSGSGLLTRAIAERCPWIKGEENNICPFDLISSELRDARRTSYDRAYNVNRTLFVRINSPKECVAFGYWDMPKLFSPEESSAEYALNVISESGSWGLHFFNSHTKHFYNAENPILQELLPANSAMNQIAQRFCPVSYSWGSPETVKM